MVHYLLEINGELPCSRNKKKEDILYLLTTNKIFLIKWAKGPKAMEGNQPHGCNLT
jgi:hypothetical protein